MTLCRYHHKYHIRQVIVDLAIESNDSHASEDILIWDKCFMLKHGYVIICSFCINVWWEYKRCCII